MRAALAGWLLRLRTNHAVAPPHHDDATKLETELRRIVDKAAITASDAACRSRQFDPQRSTCAYPPVLTAEVASIEEYDVFLKSEA
jgi:hypothetical protein